MSTPTDRYLVISADCHAGPPRAALRDYLDPPYRADLDDYVAASAQAGDLTFEDGMLEVGVDADLAAMHSQRARHAIASLCDSSLRFASLEDDGIVAEVIFPDVALENGPPFQEARDGEGRLIRRGTERYPYELQVAGARAYNRWLGEFCADAAGRRAGVAVLPRLEDVDAAVELLMEARELGLHGGFVLPLVGHGLPGYNHERYEPLWDAAVDLDLPVNCHAETGGPDDPFVYGSGVDSYALEATEIPFFARRPLWFLLWGGVLERRPTMRLVFTEQFADWIPAELHRLDELYDTPVFLSELRKTVTTRPSEVWARQCFVGATFMSRDEAAMRDAIGLDTIMWGSDFPHPESTWPHTRASLARTFAGVPPADVGVMVGANAARVYGFSIDELRPVADRIGPTHDDLAAEPAELPADYIGMGFR